jgi:hydroxyethylthiazole kinase-like uncharacterized protein yjeF
MRLVTNTEMSKIDRWAINKLRIPGTVLMENAGRGCANIIEDYFDPEGLRILIICGTGNNGGDGFVMARHLQNRGADVQTVLAGKGTGLKGDAQSNYRLCRHAEIPVHEITDMRKIKKVFQDLQPDVVVDAIFGTGFKGAPEGFHRNLIEFINGTDAFIFSVDVPSGINGDTGQFNGVCVMADATATMCLPKRGNYLYPGRAACGDLYVVDIGIPYHLIDEGYPRIIEYDDILRLMPFRPADGHKGTFGTVLVIAGARGFSGAAVMASMAALRSGAGMVRLAAPRGIMDALESKLLEVVKIPLSQTVEKSIGPDACDELTPVLKESDAVIIGPGITTHPGTAEFLLRLLPRISMPVVIDADALNILAKNPATFKNIKAPFILTPHPGELGRITGRAPQDINQDRIDLSQRVSKDLGGVLVLKGAPTVIATPDGEIHINPTGNSGLASAGSGDVLAGMIGGFLAQRCSLSQASRLGVFLHGACGDLCAEEQNEYALIAGDLIERIPDAMNYVLDQEYRESQHDE